MRRKELQLPWTKSRKVAREPGGPPVDGCRDKVCDELAVLKKARAERRGAGRVLD